MSCEAATDCTHDLCWPLMIVSPDRQRFLCSRCGARLLWDGVKGHEPTIQGCIPRAEWPAKLKEMAGKAIHDDHVAAVDRWHAGEGEGQTLAEYLGMDSAEYARWVENR